MFRTLLLVLALLGFAAAKPSVHSFENDLLQLQREVSVRKHFHPDEEIEFYKTMTVEEYKDLLFIDDYFQHVLKYENLTVSKVFTLLRRFRPEFYARAVKLYNHFMARVGKLSEKAQKTVKKLVSEFDREPTENAREQIFDREVDELGLSYSELLEVFEIFNLINIETQH